MNDAHDLPPQPDIALQRIAAAGYKLTAPRRAVIASAACFAGSFSAAEIDTHLAEQGHRLGEASLFRTLKLMTDIGVMQRIHGIDDCHRYILSSESHAHRVVCTGCGAIAAFAECDLEPMIRMLESRTGFTIVDHLLELFGTCPRCARATATT